MFDMGGSFLYGQAQLGEELLIGKFYDDFVESLFESNDADTNYTTSSSPSFMALPYLEYYPFSGQSFVSLPSLEIDEQCYYLDCCCQYSKRRKTNYYYNDLHYSMNTFPQCPEEFLFPKTEQFTQLPVPMIYENTAKKKSSSPGERSLSVQSVAARQRRRKISEKTQELGKLIPGANRMNSTADMFQAAYKYVQYLQAQVGILQLMESKDFVPNVEEQLEVLLASPTIQEKLYSEDKCLVPQEFVEALAKDNYTIQSNPSDLSRHSVPAPSKCCAQQTNAQII
ncbi:hypothetical protein AQUCO_00300697v1 [Aquilegia coerulea]|uniref:BHLH domain-containing protein n=1 Tax=Aquilegia coerulea TaxID=218851 RepID=A0A2G5F0A5_AQUCA|nr:hypothetical protein AQUCO_00300697v1 [Aquilegia coerulea]